MKVFMAILFTLPFMVGTGCLPEGLPPARTNPFTGIERVSLDGREHILPATIAPIGMLQQGNVYEFEVRGQSIDAVWILASDNAATAKGVIVGGGPANEPFFYRVPSSSEYFIYVQFDPTLAEAAQLAALTGSPADVAFAPPPSQPVLVAFMPGYLTDPGLVDPTSFTEEETALLESISDLIEIEVVSTLRSIFADTPIEILTESDALPSQNLSKLTLCPQRVLADDVTEFDSALPTVDLDSPCAVPVVFGEVLTAGRYLDPGNHNLEDEAVVYVGSFQGRGLTCRTAVIESVNSIVLALSHTAAHEIGHLVGLQHVASVDVMDRRVTAAFQRQLSFERGQLLIDVPVRRADGSMTLETVVQTNIIQDPDRYFDSVFYTPE